ncbi:MAG: hypothetical protein KDC38_16450, partial [Planctomycetes bacterium]|nr:hypothetical protein [Planctomycetota bacterium]
RLSMSPREWAEVQPLLPALEATVGSFEVLQTDRRLRLEGRLTGVPCVGPLIEELILRERHGVAGPIRAEQVPPPRPVGDL